MHLDSERLERKVLFVGQGEIGTQTLQEQTGEHVQLSNFAGKARESIKKGYLQHFGAGGRERGGGRNAAKKNDIFEHLAPRSAGYGASLGQCYNLQT